MAVFLSVKCCRFLGGSVFLSTRYPCTASRRRTQREYIFFFLFFTLVTGPRRSLSLELSDTESMSLKYEPASEGVHGSVLVGQVPGFESRVQGLSFQGLGSRD